RQLYMGHMALSDIDGERHIAAERFTRGAAGLAGAEIRPFRVWLEEWSAEGVGDPESIWPMRLRSGAATDKGTFQLDIELDAVKNHVLQGDRGLSWKHEGGASYYYSFTRIDAAGTVELDGERFDVTGAAWLDREWSTSTLSEEQAGWDWFSLQLEDGRDLMYYQLRQKDGDAHPMSAGVLVEADGTYTTLERDDVQLDVLDRWTSPRSQGRYPVLWRLQAPKYGIDLGVEPLFEDQELDIAFRYWEGAVNVRIDGDIAGRGFVELVGYADEAAESGR
ncbi:MAG: lipocalin family protein, partial [Acidobacteriota bacterium]